MCSSDLGTAGNSGSAGTGATSGNPGTANNGGSGNAGSAGTPSTSPNVLVYPYQQIAVTVGSGSAAGSVTVSWSI